MGTWKPVPGTKVTFHVDAVDGPYHPSRVPKGGLTVEERNRRAAEFLGRFDLKWKEHQHLQLRLDDPRWPALLDGIEGLAVEGALGVKAAWLEEPEPKPSDPQAWFEVAAGPTEFRSPAKAPKGMHFGWRDGQFVASEVFLKVAREAGLTGLGSLPLVESRAGDPMTWYEVFAEEPIGRGLDHPMLDPAKHGAEMTKNKLDPARRWGESVAWLAKFRGDVKIDDPVVERLIKLAPERFFRIDGPHRFVREHLPRTDFAYMGWGFRADNGPGYEGRPIRTICCNARARKALIDAGVMKPSRFDAMVTVPAAEAQAEILDRTVPHPLPPPVYTPEEAAEERRRREETRASAAPAAPRLAFASIEEAVKALRRRLEDGTATWEPASESEEFEEIRSAELLAKTPRAWQLVAPLLPMEVCAPSADGGEDGEMFELFLAVPEWNDWLAYEPGSLPPEEEPSTEDLVIARTPYGDWYAVRMGDPLLPEDARVVHWDHETTTIKDEWPSVAAFVAEIVEACGRGEGTEG